MISQRLLPVLQLTRMALVFTAIADSTCALLLRAAAARLRQDPAGSEPVWAYLDARQLVATAVVSMGLYGFGMSLNDIIDRRRDTTVAPTRPLPSGRIGVVGAHVVCALLALAALAGGAWFAWAGVPHGWVTLAVVIWTGLLITFYDTAGKYLVWPGLVCLGLIRFFHALVPAPEIPVLWHPLLLLNHVAILSAVAYRWEQKRPPLTPPQGRVVLIALAVIDAAAIGLCAMLRRGVRARADAGAPLADAGAALVPAPALPGPLWPTPWLALPAGAMLLFVALGLWMRHRYGPNREAGQALMLYGLLWLIVYDACFALAYAGWVPAAVIAGLLPLAWGSVHLMRAWSRFLAAAQRPDYKRAGTGSS